MFSAFAGRITREPRSRSDYHRASASSEYTDDRAPHGLRFGASSQVTSDTRLLDYIVKYITIHGISSDMAGSKVRE